MNLNVYFFKFERLLFMIFPSKIFFLLALLFVGISDITAISISDRTGATGYYTLSKNGYYLGVTYDENNIPTLQLSTPNVRTLRNIENEDEVRWLWDNGYLTCAGNSAYKLLVNNGTISLTTGTGTQFTATGSTIKTGKSYISWDGSKFSVANQSRNSVVSDDHNVLVNNEIYYIYCDHSEAANKNWNAETFYGGRWYLNSTLFPDATSNPEIGSIWKFQAVFDGTNVIPTYWKILNEESQEYLGLDTREGSDENRILLDATGNTDAYRWALTKEGDTDLYDEDRVKRFDFEKYNNDNYLLSHYSTGSKFVRRPASDQVALSMRTAKVSEPTLKFGYSSIPDNKNAIRTIRFSQNDINSRSGVVIPIYDHDKVERIPADQVKLSATDDPFYWEKTDALTKDCDAWFKANRNSLGLIYEPTSHQIKMTLPSEVEFKEGYSYQLAFTCFDNINAYTVVYLNFKIVPKYLTWDPQTSHENDWNYDGNWRMSRAGDWGEGLAPSDLPTIAPSQTIYGVYCEQKGYVPLNHSYITLPNVEDKSPKGYPILTNPGRQKYESEQYPSIANSGGIEDKNSIRYDIYFHANTCDKIHFEPNSELVGQNYLYYDFAWVETMLQKDRWYMLTSPFKETYSGDYFLTKSGKDISAPFRNLDSGPETRIYPAIAQRAWSKTVNSYLEIGNTTATPIAAKVASWSSRYNALNQKFIPGEGIALKIVTDEGYGTGELPEKMTYRLPKANNIYYYQDHEGKWLSDSENIPQRTVTKNLFHENTMTIQKDETGEIFVVGNPLMSHLDMAAFFDANPFLVQDKYWILVNNTIKPEDLTLLDEDKANYPKLAPMQSFFVKAASPTNTLTVNLNDQMCVTDLSVDNRLKILTRNQNVVPMLTIKASRGDYSSEAIIIIDPLASDDYVASEDMEAIFDSKLGETPTLFTVAGDQSLLINKLINPDIIPIGISSSSDESVVLSFDGLSQLGFNAELYDAQTQISVPLQGVNPQVDVSGNNANRYYLKITRSTTGMDQEGKSQTKVYSAQKGELTVLSTALNRTVEVYSLQGIIYRRFPITQNVQTVDLASGTYLLKIKGENQIETFKVNVK